MSGYRSFSIRHLCDCPVGWMRSQLIKVRNILEAQGRGFQSIASRSKEAKVVGPRSLVMLQHLDEPRVVCVQLGP